MRKTSRWMAVLLLLPGSAACAHDRILAAEIAASSAGPVPYRISCSRTLAPPEDGQQPLYVVDGVIEDQIADIRAGDIEGIHVIRGAEAAALYGARGANGVVVVTTRAGKARAGS